MARYLRLLNRTFYIGQSYQGGIIFWLDASKKHGLIAAKQDIGNGIHWWNGVHRVTGATCDGVYAGKMNTALIIAAQMQDNPNGSFAAKLCADYTAEGEGLQEYGDWYLPSQYELNLMLFKQSIIGGFRTIPYWSSTENDIDQVYTMDASPIKKFSHSFKDGATYYVRPIRAF